MSLGLRLDLRQTQSLVLTPQLQQAIKLLQLSNMELAGVVDRELADNPFLARTDEGERSGPVADTTVTELDGSLGFNGARGTPDSGWSAPGVGPAADQRLRIARASGQGSREDDASFEGRFNRPLTLADHLRAQLVGGNGSARAASVGRVLVDFLGEDGYLREPDAALAEALQLSQDDIVAGRAALQSCDPAGVGARDLAECLALQLEERDRLDPAMRSLIENLPLLARADFAGLQRVCRVDLEDLRDMIAEIKQLDPRPGLSFAPAEPIDVVPDLLVMRADDGWRVELNEATLPRLLVDRGFYAQMTAGCRDRAAREFMSERYQSASWLVKALAQRARTLLRVGEAIFERQAGFLVGGPHQLRPLVLRDIAEATSLHESTVSRATADKYVATPRGTFPLRYFFTTAIAATDGEATHSAEAIRQQIRRMVDSEDPINVLSDDQIVDTLKERGVAIARRTVAKYRESLGIPSSVQRRRSKALSR